MPISARDIGGPVVRGKMQPPSFSDTFLHRRRLDERIGQSRRVVLVTAPAGYGKSVAARHWLASTDRPTGWLSIDLLDADPLSFWRHFLAVARQLVPEIDDEPELLLAERGLDDHLFLGALTAQLESVERRVGIVLDGLVINGPIIDGVPLPARSLLDGLSLLVERVSEVLQLIVTSRAELPLPLARWRSRGWLTEIRAAELAFTDHEAVALAGRMPAPRLSHHSVRSVNRRLEGWPIGVHLALLALDDGADHRSARASIGARRQLTEYVVAEVLDRLHPNECDVALSLSVVEWFDAELCGDLVGGHGLPIARDLHRRGMFLTLGDAAGGAMRFHPMFRELLETELRWRDPVRRIELHRRAAALWSKRGEINQAYRHLVAIGDVEAAHQLVMQPALDLVDRSAVVALRELVHRFPTRGDVDNPELAIDLAIVWFFTGETDEAGRWCDHALSLTSDADLIHRLRIHETRCMLAMAQGDLDTAYSEVDHRNRMAPLVRTMTPFSRRFPTVAARVMLASAKLDEAGEWLDRAELIEDPAIIVHVTVPALRSWYEWKHGRLLRASELANGALRWIDEHGIGSHRGAFEAFVTAGWCEFGAGRIALATAHAQRAWADAQSFSTPWNYLQAGLLLAQIALVVDGPGPALDVIDDVRSLARTDGPNTSAERFPSIEAISLARLGRVEEAMRIVEKLPDSPRARLLRAQVALPDPAELMQLLATRATWPTPDRLLADLLLALGQEHDFGALSVVVAEGAATGWVSPFLGHPPERQQRLRALPLHRLHPALARIWEPTVDDRPAPGAGWPAEPLTTREQTLLELLPTHLSYAQIGEQLFLSVNTVKTNLKSVYRKLGVHSRSEAVDRGRHLGLL